MKLLKNGFLAFDYVLPVYNWFFPSDLRPSYVGDFGSLEQRIVSMYLQSKSFPLKLMPKA